MLEAIKALLKSNFPNDDSYEGIWMHILEGDDLAGIGILGNEPFGVAKVRMAKITTATQAHLGDIVEYHSPNPDHKPYIMLKHNLHDILADDDYLSLKYGEWIVEAAKNRMRIKAEKESKV